MGFLFNHRNLNLSILKKPLLLFRKGRRAGFGLAWGGLFSSVVRELEERLQPLHLELHLPIPGVEEENLHVFVYGFPVAPLPLIDFRKQVVDHRASRVGFQKFEGKALGILYSACLHEGPDAVGLQRRRVRELLHGLLGNLDQLGPLPVTGERLENFQIL